MSKIYQNENSDADVNDMKLTIHLKSSKTEKKYMDRSLHVKMFAMQNIQKYPVVDECMEVTSVKSHSAGLLCDSKYLGYNILVIRVEESSVVLHCK